MSMQAGISSSSSSFRSKWQGGTTCEQQKLRYLNCYASSTALSVYYERLGYREVGEVETYPGYSERMFHKRL